MQNGINGKNYDRGLEAERNQKEKKRKKLAFKGLLFIYHMMCIFYTKYKSWVM